MGGTNRFTRSETVIQKDHGTLNEPNQISFSEPSHFWFIDIFLFHVHPFGPARAAGGFTGLSPVDIQRAREWNIVVFSLSTEGWDYEDGR